ncbi:MAG: hypothetical protein QNJ91_06990 [Gammaproteobacteria bacterium]|nr:hypothetical protein [Gammaproteobacteria bacterium]
MNTSQLPSVELVQGAPPPVATGPARWRRWKVFFSVLLITAAIGLALVYSRSPVYRASASVLTVKPKAVDTRSAEADIEHVAIQGRLLLGEELLGRLSLQLEDAGDGLIAGLDALRNMLSVVPVPDTNLLELRAEGADPQQLQRVVNRWAESYEVFRAEEIEAATGRTTAEIGDQQEQLAGKIERARAELLAFRQANEIVGLERGENRALASLKGLNQSLNKARDTLIEARARKAAIDEAIARGETVVPSEQKTQIADLRLAVQRGQARLADLRQRYTQAYLDRDPDLKQLPATLREQERELQSALRIAKATVADEASQAVEAARVSLGVIERKLIEQQDAVQQFNESYKAFKALEEDLARLERLHADNSERLAQIEVKNLQKYPPIQIVEWARVPTRPIHPNYERDLLIALAVALGLALFVTWLVEYLSEKSSASAATPQIGVRIYAGDQAPALAAAANAPLPHQPAAAPPLQAPADLPVLPRELSGAEVQSVLAALDSTTSGYAALLLSGVSPYELALLHANCFDRTGGTVGVPGAGARRLAVRSDVWPRLDAIIGDMDDAHLKLPVAELDLRLRTAAERARVADPRGVTALALWHTYVVFLIRQGIDVTTLIARVGNMPPDILDTLLHYAPPGGHRPAGGIDFTYPALGY